MKIEGISGNDGVKKHKWFIDQMSKKKNGMTENEAINNCASLDYAALEKLANSLHLKTLSPLDDVDEP